LDFRHPTEINRSNDILLDSDRRDFTINCIYYTTAENIELKNNE
jgi:tRNA nucleotidyltransferase/poly(A) polymerase